MSAWTWEVKPDGLVTPAGNRMKASCKHRKNGACGGCYARLYVLMEEIEKDPESAEYLVRAVSFRMRGEP